MIVNLGKARVQLQWNTSQIDKQEQDDSDLLNIMGIDASTVFSKYSLVLLVLPAANEGSTPDADLFLAIPCHIGVHSRPGQIALTLMS